MKNKFKKSFLFQAFLFLILSIISLSFITSSNSTHLSTEKISLIEITDKNTNDTTNTTEIVDTNNTESTTKQETTNTKTNTSTQKTTTKKTTNNTNTTSSTSNNKSTTTISKSEKYGLEVGTISISNSNFSKDLVKDDGSYYYLNYNLDKVKDNRGVPFIDFRTDFTGRKTIIYSHSAKDGKSPFNYLQNYNGNQSFYNNHKYIIVNYGGKTYTYLIFSAYISIADNDYDEGLEYFREMDYTDEEWAEKIQEYKNNSDYDTGVSVSASDKILILQTCSMDNRYYKKYYRYNQLVMGKLVSVN